MAAVLLSPALAAAATHGAEALLGLGACAQAIKALKYGGFPVDASLRAVEVAWLAALASALAGAGVLAGAWVGALAALAVGALGAAVLLDAVLFRVFTIELGPGGVRDIVPSVLVRELSQLARARAFFRAHAGFAALPLGVGMAAALASTPAASTGLRAVLLGAVVLSVILATRTLDAGHRARALAPLALLSLAAFGARVAPAGVAPLALLAAGAALLSLAGLRAGRDRGPAELHRFFAARRPAGSAGLAPRVEHTAVVEHAPQAPAPSALHGRAAGADVVMLTFESVGRDHLEVHRAGGARAPLFEQVRGAGLGSARHFCVCPTTNNAHVAWYYSGYEARGESAVAALSRAGYHTVYLTTARARDYGLREILHGAGFETVIDGEALGAPDADGELPRAGLAALAELPRDGRPIFLHVHATNTHLPYRVSDPARFNRFDARDDAGRFLNGVEEADAVFAALLDGLRARGVVRGESVTVVTSDHGQAFGALGYHSHGSAVVADEVLVPFALAHPALPALQREASSHFDVLPTVLDAVGVPLDAPGYGSSLYRTEPARVEAPGLLLWAGHPSRTTTSNYGLVVGREKYMADLVLDRYHRMDWEDGDAEVLAGEERDYVAALLGHLMRLRGVR